MHSLAWQAKMAQSTTIAAEYEARIAQLKADHARLLERNAALERVVDLKLANHEPLPEPQPVPVGPLLLQCQPLS